MILGKIDDIGCISLKPEMSLEELISEVSEVIDTKDYSDLLIITDLFGGTPNNVATYFNQKNKVPVICGLNLPMLISIITNRSNNSNDIKELINQAEKDSKNGISVILGG